MAGRIPRQQKGRRHRDAVTAAVRHRAKAWAHRRSHTVQPAAGNKDVMVERWRPTPTAAGRRPRDIGPDLGPPGAGMMAAGIRRRP